MKRAPITGIAGTALLGMWVALGAAACGNEAPSADGAQAGQHFADDGEAFETIAREARARGLTDVEVGRDASGRAFNVTIGQQQADGNHVDEIYQQLMVWLGGPERELTIGARKIKLGDNVTAPRPAPGVEVRTAAATSIPNHKDECTGPYCTANQSSFSDIGGFFHQVGSTTQEYAGGMLHWTTAVYTPPPDPESPGHCDCPAGYQYMCPSPTQFSCMDGGPTCAPDQLECLAIFGHSHLILSQTFLTTDIDGTPQIAILETHVNDNQSKIENTKTYFGSISCPETGFPSCSLSGICTAHDSEHDGLRVFTRTADGTYDCQE